MPNNDPQDRFSINCHTHDGCMMNFYNPDKKEAQYIFHEEQRMIQILQT